MNKPVLCEKSGAPIDLCPFEQVGEPSRSEYEPDLVYCIEKCQACGEVRHKTKSYDDVIKEIDDSHPKGSGYGTVIDTAAYIIFIIMLLAVFEYYFK